MLFSAAILAARRTAVLAVALLLAALVTIGHLRPLPAAFAFWSDPIVLQFASGMLVAVAFRAGWRCPTWFSCGLISAGVGCYLPTLHGDAIDLPRGISSGLPALCILAGVVFIQNPKDDHRVADAFRLLGDASYALYLIHPFVFVSPRRLFPEAITTVSSPALYGLFLLGCSIAVAILVHLALEKPTTRMLGRGISRILDAVRGAPSVATRDSASGDRRAR